MKYFDASFYYIRYKVLADVISETYRNFDRRVWLLSVVFVFLFFLHQLVSLVFRLLDEIFHRGYRDVKIRQPVFIIANPRSGTTFLHRLIAMDEEQFVYTKNAHTFFMSSSFVQFYNIARWIDRKILSGMVRKMITKLDDLFWGGWDDIHEMGFNKAEEDELVFAQTLNSPGVFIPFPYFHLNGASTFLDNDDVVVRKEVMDFYESSLKRFLFRAGKTKTYLAKNVMSTGRFKTLLQRFPEAKIIYIARHPYDALPSLASMFTLMYGKSIPKDAPPRKAWAQYGIDFYKYSKEMRRTIPASQFVVVKYDDLLTEPQKTVMKIYRHFNWPISDKFVARLSQVVTHHKDYKSTHEYSLEEYGLSKAHIYNELGDIMDEYGFGKEF